MSDLTSFLRRLFRFMALASPDRRLVLSVAFLHGLVMATLGGLPLVTVRRLLGRAVVVMGLRPTSPERVAWAVEAVTRKLSGGGTCLVRALVTEAMLREGGEDARLRLGVARGQDGRVLGHAWVEARGRVVVGDEQLGRYTAFPGLEPPAALRAPLRP